LVQLFEQNITTNDRQSSKGNQLKWQNGEKWYKADYAGYEGLAEFMVSRLLELSNIDKNNYVLYDTEEIRYKYQNFLGCRSTNFLPEGWQMITLERLFQSMYGQSLNRAIYTIKDHAGRLQFLVQQTERMTGLKDFGKYMCKLLTIDALFLNEDRHTHNIAVLLDEYKEFHLCPFFDHGAALLSDTTMDYPMGEDFEQLVNHVKPKTFCNSFDEQLNIAEVLYGQQVRFHFTRSDVEELLRKEKYYPNEIKKRVQEVILEQKRRYQYLFEK